MPNSEHHNYRPGAKLNMLRGWYSHRRPRDRCTESDPPCDRLRQVRRRVDTQYFWDNTRKIDMVLAYRDDDDVSKAHRRKAFTSNLMSEGLEIEVEEKEVCCRGPLSKGRSCYTSYQFSPLGILSCNAYPVFIQIHYLNQFDIINTLKHFPFLRLVLSAMQS